MSFSFDTPSDRPTRTRFGGRQRPHFLMKGWITFGGGLPEAAAGAQRCAVSPNSNQRGA
jgi:hypothetical protein